MPEILRFAQDDNCVFEYGVWNSELQIISAVPSESWEIAANCLRVGATAHPSGANPRDDRVSLSLPS